MSRMPVEPPPTRLKFPNFADFGEVDLVMVGGDLEPGTVLAAYRHGLFPMHTADGRLGWWSPMERGILPLDQFRISKSLRRSRSRFRVSFDRDLGGVIDGCADPGRESVWINDEIKRTYLRLGELGWVHSVESWDEEGRLVGGLYGVAIGALFAGESMFFRERDASKVALAALVDVLLGQPGTLLDVQWVTPHLQGLGATVISRDRYQQLLSAALASPRVVAPWREL